MPFFVIFIDFTKTFDTVNWKALWNILRKLVSTDHFVRQESALHIRMKASVSLRGELSEPFEVENRRKQDCVFAPTFFSIFLSMFLSDAFTDSTQGKWIQSRLESNLFNASRFLSARMIRNVLVRLLMFSEDTTFVKHNNQNSNEIITRLSKSVKIIRGLKWILGHWPREREGGCQELTQLNKFNVSDPHSPPTKDSMQN